MRPLGVVAAAAAIFLIGCGKTTGQRSGQGDARQILNVLASARAALLNDRPKEVCGLLTAHARTRVLGFQVDFAAEGTPVPSNDPRLPQTCEAVVQREWAAVRKSDGAITWPADLRRVRFSVVSVHGSSAKARLKVAKPYGPVIEISLRKNQKGWRIDDSNGIPAGY